MIMNGLITIYSDSRFQRQPRIGLFARLIRLTRHRRQYDHILDQPDHILEDVGLTRAEIIAQRGQLRF